VRAADKKKIDQGQLNFKYVDSVAANVRCSRFVPDQPAQASYRLHEYDSVETTLAKRATMSRAISDRVHRAGGRIRADRERIPDQQQQARI